MKTPNRKLYRIAIPFSLLAALAATIMAQNQAPPDKAFKTSHLLNLPSDMTEGAVLSVLSDMNQAIAKAGCTTCRYALFKVSGQQQGTYSYMFEASWPGGAVYTKVHTDPGYQAALKRHPEFEGKVMKDEIYNRYVEVLPAKK